VTIIYRTESRTEISNNSSNKPKVLEKCFVCGGCESFFREEGTSIREARCPKCGASRRNSDVAKVITDTYVGVDRSLSEVLSNLENLNIYEAQSNGPIHSQLSNLPKYVCSEYFCYVAPGSTNEFGIRCEDLQSLSFPNDAFDLVITQDVLEHVPDPERAFSEISRVLKPDGCHIFTVPYHEGKKSIKRVKIEEGKEVYLLPPVFHLDPLRKSGALVYTDFGEDLSDLLRLLGYETDIIFSLKWYNPGEIPYIEDKISYKIYQSFYEKNELIKYFKYNSVTFRSKKNDGKKQVKSMLNNTGERYLPFVDPMTTGAEIHYEHLHRYAFALQFVKDKYVLDLASGEGYGSYLLANEASGVVGVEIDESAVAHSCAKYSKINLEFKRGSILKIPIDGRNIFDVIVCFEALEHVEDHDMLFSEVKRLLKENGIFIVSTPNKKVYSDEANYHNPFHLKELYFDDFKNILHRYFSNNSLYGQRAFTGSNIWCLSTNSELHCNEFVIEKENDDFSFKSKMDKVPMYFISIASDAPICEITDKTSYLIDKSNILTAKLADQVTPLSKQLQQANAHASSLEYEIAEMRKSIFWQLTMKFHRGFVERALPPNSRCRNWYDLGLNGMRILANEGLPKFLSNFQKWLSNRKN
jgi:2-polyprenyl-3-methyl-5-hydroxy-6-metoxy-1,4-benzoquinol methylase